MTKFLNDAETHTGRPLWSLLNAQGTDMSSAHNPMDWVPEEWNPSDPSGSYLDNASPGELEHPNPTPSASQTLAQSLFPSDETCSTSEGGVSPYQADQYPQLSSLMTPRVQSVKKTNPDFCSWALHLVKVQTLGLRFRRSRVPRHRRTRNFLMISSMKWISSWR